MTKDNSNIFFVIRNAFGPLSVSLRESINDYVDIYETSIDSDERVFYGFLMISGTFLYI